MTACSCRDTGPLNNFISVLRPTEFQRQLHCVLHAGPPVQGRVHAHLLLLEEKGTTTVHLLDGTLFKKIDLYLFLDLVKGLKQIK